MSLHSGKTRCGDIYSFGHFWGRQCHSTPTNAIQLYKFPTFPRPVTTTLEDQRATQRVMGDHIYYNTILGIRYANMSPICPQSGKKILLSPYLCPLCHQEIYPNAIWDWRRPETLLFLRIPPTFSGAFLPLYCTLFISYLTLYTLYLTLFIARFSSAAAPHPHHRNPFIARPSSKWHRRQTKSC